MTAKIDPTIVTLPESVDPERFIVATYYIETEAEDLYNLASAIAIEQTTGTWVKVPGETPEVRERHVARVVNILEVPDIEFDMGPREGRRKIILQLAFPWANFGCNIPELLTTVIGNISMSGYLKLVDLQFPSSWVSGFQGPKFGIGGLRKHFGQKHGPLVLGMIKPCTGLNPKQTGDLFYQLASSGVQMIKDDELISEADHAPTLCRVEECRKAIDKLKGDLGYEPLYFVNLTDRPDRMLKMAYAAIDAGANALMVCGHSAGYGALEMISTDPKLNVPLLSHCSFAGALSNSPFTGVSSHLVHGKFPRLAGADIVVYPTPFGKLCSTQDKSTRIATAMRAPFHGLKSTAPLPGGGMHAGVMWETIAQLGEDWVIGVGAAMHGHPEGIKVGTLALKQSAQAALDGLTPQQAAETYPELGRTLKIWPAQAPASAIFDLKR
jgi:2,3-diketo-5-methylthiopentyl-1-phosphate enolase